jgi:hypothetical protein
MDQKLKNSDTSINVPPEIRIYLEGLLIDAGMTSTEENLHEEMINELYLRLDNFIVATIINNIPDEDLEEFIRLNEEKRPKEELEKFLKEKIPNFQDVFAQAFIEFRDLYLGSYTVAKNSPM